MFLLLLHIARSNELRVDSLGAKLQCSQQILNLPQVENIFRYVLLTFCLCYIHNITFVILHYNPQSAGLASFSGALGTAAKKSMPVMRSSSLTGIISLAEGLRPDAER